MTPPASRRWLFAFWAVLFDVLTVQQSGRTTFDTKLGVNLDPAGFAVRLWDLWSPLQWFGGIQNQYIGYAFPMLPFSLAAHLLHVPVWLAERLWMSLLLAAGFWGMVRLAERLGTGNRATRLIAGAVFALWPTYTILVGSTSAAVLAPLLTPWVVLQLSNGRRTPRTAAARAGLIVVCMGGVNAVVTLAALLLPTMWVVVHRQWRLLAWWTGSVLLATLWWLVPLLYQGQYGYNFLPYIETAAGTTSTMSAAAVLRGAGNWVAYLDLGKVWLPAGWAMVSHVWTVSAGALAAAAGLAGLADRDLPERTWLRCSAAVAAVIALAGYWGPLGGPLSPWVRHLLDGPLAPIRNVYKWEPVLATVLCLGIAHSLARLPRVSWRAAAAVAVLAGLAFPYMTDQILQPGSFREIPSQWYQTAAFLKKNSPRMTALVVPADSHGHYSWGSPIDEPLEPLAASPWVQRDLVPFSGGGVRNLLESAEKAIAGGAVAPGLPAYLGRAGIRYVVVRNDLDPDQLDYTAPGPIHESLRKSGFTQVAAFGPHAPRGSTASLKGIEYPAVEIYQAADPAARPETPARILTANGSQRVSGGPQSLLQLSAQGLLSPDQAVVMAGSPAPSAPGGQIVTDGLRRVDTLFNLTTRNASYTYTATENNPVDDAQGRGGQPPLQFLPVPAAPNQTVAVLKGAATVEASSYGSWYWREPQHDPVAAFDGDPGTAWTEGRPDTAVGQWIRITFDQPVDLPGRISIRLLKDTGRPVITKLRVTTDRGVVTSAPTGPGDVQDLTVPAGPTRSILLSLAEVGDDRPGGSGAGIAEVGIPGVTVSRALATPAPAQDGLPTSYSFRRDTAASLGLPGHDPEPRLDRLFTTTDTAARTVSANAVAEPGTELDALIKRLAGQGDKLTITANSTFGSLPYLNADNLLDGSADTAWVAGGDSAKLTVRWKGRKLIDRINLTYGARSLAAAPAEIRITGSDGTRDLEVPADGRLRFAPLSTDHLELSFPRIRAIPSTDPVTGITAVPPVGLAELDIPALATLRATPAQPDRPFRLPCGQGPSLSLDGRTHPTSASGSFADLLQLRPVKVVLCSPHSQVVLAPGTHRLEAVPGGALSLTDLALAAPQATAPSPSRDLTVESWGATNRRLRIGPGGQSYLLVHQSVNAGWKATLNGRLLTPVTLDGWQQGFAVPAGAGGPIRLWFAPVGSYHALLGLAAAALVGLAALTLSRRHSTADDHPSGGPPADPRTQVSPSDGPATERSAATVVRTATMTATRTETVQAVHLECTAPGTAGVVIMERRAGTKVAVSLIRSVTGGRFMRLACSRYLAQVVAVMALVGIVGGLAAVVVPVLDRLPVRLRPAMAGGAMVVSGLASAWGVWEGRVLLHGAGAFGAVAQGAALMALALGLLPGRRA